MHPSAELKELAARRAALQVRISVHRAELQEAWGVVSRPIATVDAVWRRWRAWAPWLALAAAPAGVLLGRTVVRRRTAVGRVLRWAPVAGSLLRFALSLRSGRRGAGLDREPSSPP